MEMKWLQALRAGAIVFALAVEAGPAFAVTIADSQAISHVGQNATVQGTVSNVHISGKGTVFINFGASYPNQDFTAVIFSSSAGAFGDVMKLEGKKLAVTGPITMWKGKPEMILRVPGALQILH
jgi:hypothetical protein